MSRLATPLALATVLSLGLAACGSPGAPPSGTTPAPAPERVDPAMTALAPQIARFAPTDLSADVAGLPDSERRALAHMIRAAQVMDALFLRQVWAGNESTLSTLVTDDTPIGQARLRYFLINKGPWSR
ncbi:MAG: hypothetical protein JNL48_11895, partial [Acidobacteria bacterium]|nr:hypothetical protein [Acidobacteriota bacterium]